MALVDLCRLCGSDTRNTERNSIFEGEGRLKTYALRILECLTLQVSEEDELPKVMCGECTNKLNLLSDFRSKAVQTETDLLSKIYGDKVKDELPEIIDFDKDDVDDDFIYFRLSSPEPLLQPVGEINEGDENPPKKRSPTKRTWREIESEEDEAPSNKRIQAPKQPLATTPDENSTVVDWNFDLEDDSLFDCQVCGESFASESTLQLHLRMCINSGRELRVLLQRLPSEKALSLQEDSNKHVCHLCGELAQDKEELQTHVQKHSTLLPDLIMCASKRCSRVFCSASDLQRHVEHAHSLVRPFKCTVCDASFDSKVQLSKHAHRPALSSNVLFKCQVCCKLFKNHIAFKIHVAQHQDDTSAPSQGHAKQKHLDKGLLQGCSSDTKSDCLQKSSGVVIVCNVPKCEFTCSMLRDLNLHKSRVHSIWPHMCQPCGIGFISASCLKRHLEAHKAEESLHGKGPSTSF